MKTIKIIKPCILANVEREKGTVMVVSNELARDLIQDNEAEYHEDSVIEDMLKESVKQEAQEDYRLDLLELDGLGEKTAADILSRCPTITDLRNAISKGESIVDNDSLNTLIIEAFRT